MNRVLRDSTRSSGSGFSVFSSARENNSKALVPERKGTIADKPSSILGLFRVHKFQTHFACDIDERGASKN